MKKLFLLALVAIIGFPVLAAPKPKPATKAERSAIIKQLKKDGKLLRLKVRSRRPGANNKPGSGESVLTADIPDIPGVVASSVSAPEIPASPSITAKQVSVKLPDFVYIVLPNGTLRSVNTSSMRPVYFGSNRVIANGSRIVFNDAVTIIQKLIRAGATVTPEIEMKVLSDLFVSDVSLVPGVTSPVGVGVDQSVVSVSIGSIGGAVKTPESVAPSSQSVVISGSSVEPNVSQPEIPESASPKVSQAVTPISVSPEYGVGNILVRNYIESKDWGGLREILTSFKFSPAAIDGFIAELKK